MRFRNLPAQHQADARTSALGGKERHKQVTGIRETRPFVAYRNLDRARRSIEAHEDAPGCFLRRIHGVAHQIDEHLLELIGIALNGQWRTFLEKHRQPRFQIAHPADEAIHLHWSELGWW